MPSNLNRTVLDNGIRIISKPMPHARSVAMGVWVNVGARDESLPESGLSHFIEHMIFKGTERRSALQIAKDFDAIGGLCNAFTSKETTCYHAKVMDVYLRTMVDLLSDILLNSVFDAQEVERERQVIFQEIKMLEDTPDEHVHILFGKTVWGKHPLGRSILGSPETVLDFDSGIIRNYFRRAYQPERMVIAAAGNLEHGAFADLVARAFETVRKIGDFPRRLPPTLGKAVALHPKDLEQVHICLGSKGLNATDPRRHALSVLNVILGGNMSSRLFQEIRERRGLAYSVYSFLSSYCDSGMWGVYVGTDKANTREVIEIIIEQLKALRQKPVDDEELRNAKEYLKGGLYLGAESTDNQMSRIAFNEIHFGRHIPLAETEAEVEKVTSEDLLALLDDILQTNGISLTLLGPMDDTSQFERMLDLS